MTDNSDFMKIRRYFVDAIARSGDRPIRFPATRKLAEMFDVSQPTALRVVRDLISDGFLEAVKSGGTISRPACEVATTIFGLLTCQGNQAIDTYYFHILTSTVCLELTKRSQYFGTQNIYLESLSQLESYVERNGLSGIMSIGVWPSRNEQLRKLREKGVPIISFSAQIDGVSSCFVPLYDMFLSVLQKLFADGKRNILLLSWPGEYYTVPVNRAIRDFLNATGLPESSVTHLLTNHMEMTKTVKDMLTGGKIFDAVFYYSLNSETYRLFAEDCNLRKDCCFVLDESSIYENMNYSGYAVRYDYTASAKIMVDNFLEQVSARDCETIQHKLPYSIVTYKNGVLV